MKSLTWFVRISIYGITSCTSTRLLAEICLVVYKNGYGSEGRSSLADRDRPACGGLTSRRRRSLSSVSHSLSSRMKRCRCGPVFLLNWCMLHRSPRTSFICLARLRTLVTVFRRVRTAQIRTSDPRPCAVASLRAPRERAGCSRLCVRASRSGDMSAMMSLIFELY